MNRLNRKVEYSLMALKHMSQKAQGQLTTAKEVADRYSAPFDATARVLQLMAQKGILKAEHGVMGGYQLTKNLNEVTLHDLMNIIQGPTKIAKCMQGHDECESEKVCNIMAPVKNLNRKLDDFYKSQTLEELLGGKHG